VHQDSELAAIAAEAPCNVGAQALLDVVKNLVVARFEAHQQQAQTVVLHDLQVL